MKTDKVYSTAVAVASYKSSGISGTNPSLRDECMLYSVYTGYIMSAAVCEICVSTPNGPHYLFQTLVTLCWPVDGSRGLIQQKEADEATSP